MHGLLKEHHARPSRWSSLKIESVQILVLLSAFVTKEKKVGSPSGCGDDQIWPASSRVESASSLYRESFDVQIGPIRSRPPSSPLPHLRGGNALCDVVCETLTRKTVI